MFVLLFHDAGDLFLVFILSCLFLNKIELTFLIRGPVSVWLLGMGFVCPAFFFLRGLEVDSPVLWLWCAGSW